MIDKKLMYLRPEVEVLGLMMAAGVLAGAGSGGFENPQVDGDFPGEDE